MALRLLSHAEQVAAHLRSGIAEGRWLHEMPGESKLEAELGVNHTTIGAALKLLENEGMLVARGGGRRRMIVRSGDAAPAKMRVGILLYEPSDHSSYDIMAIRHWLMEAGHAAIVPAKTLTELAMDVKRVARIIRKAEADAWVVISATGEVLEWFGKQPTPTIAYAGACTPDMQLALVGPRRRRAIVAMVQRLVSLGHRRIVFLAGSGVIPMPFLRELENNGIPVGPYNTPGWDHSPDGFRLRLDSLFAATPPTALILDQASLFIAAQHHLARRGIFSPHDVSLICADPDPMFEWLEPSVAHINWDRDLVVRRIARWVVNISRGKEDRRHTTIGSEFVDGGTVGPVPGK